MKNLLIALIILVALFFMTDCASSYHRSPDLVQGTVIERSYQPGGVHQNLGGGKDSPTFVIEHEKFTVIIEEKNGPTYSVTVAGTAWARSTPGSPVLIVKHKGFTGIVYSHDVEPVKQ